MIKGRSRKTQLQMAKEFGIENPPNAGGGCLLTEKYFGKKCMDLFNHVETPTTNDIDLLKIGRHFRLDEKTKLVVGRNENENQIIKALALPEDILLETKDHVGPISILRGNTAAKYTDFAASVTLRYSDAPKDKPEYVTLTQDSHTSNIHVTSAKEDSYKKYRI